MRIQRGQVVGEGLFCDFLGSETLWSAQNLTNITS
jgi:hypothetical protein